jgi:hypothetical protein
MKRRKWFATLGPNFIRVMDQNEKEGRYGFKILAIIDGFSRYPIWWKVLPAGISPAITVAQPS